jgi:hypothetical protein
VGNQTRGPGEEDLTAVVPLQLAGQVTGVISIFRLLPQKPRFEDLDHELFDLLASHAAMALHCTETSPGPSRSETSAEKRQADDALRPE